MNRKMPENTKPSAVDQIKASLRLVRIKQWIKQLFVFAPLIFSLNLFDLRMLSLTLAAFFSFSLVASSIYVINDIVDIDRDRLHPQKKKRPLPAGELSISKACVIGIVCLIFGVTLGLAINPMVIAIVIGYAILNLFYSFWAKNVIILDSMIISLGFVLRVLAGAYAILVQPSSWLIVATFFLALLMALAKRYNEIAILQGYSVNHRRVLNKYNMPLLQQMLAIVSGITIVAYSMYSMDREVMQAFHTEYLVYTVPFVVYGVFRYLYMVFTEEKGGDPTELVLKDRPMQINLILWILTVIALIY